MSRMKGKTMEYLLVFGVPVAIMVTPVAIAELVNDYRVNRDVAKVMKYATKREERDDLKTN